MVESTKSKTKPELAEVEEAAGAICVSTPCTTDQTIRDSVACVKVGLTTQVSMSEEPGEG